MKDPAKIDISRDYLPPNNNDWEKVGLYLGQCTTLKELRLGHLWDYFGGITKEVRFIMPFAVASNAFALMQHANITV